MHLYSGTPWWLVRNGLEAGADLRTGAMPRTRCDVLVVGAGITGALVADALVADGHDVVVVDRREPGTGSTAASTALLQYEIDTELLDLARHIGDARAAQAYEASAAAVESCIAIAAGLGDSVEIARTTSLYVATRRSEARRLQREGAARRAAGLVADWLDAAEVRTRWGIVCHGGLHCAPAATVDALRLTRALLRRAQDGGARIVARHGIEQVVDDGTRIQAMLDDGTAIESRWLIWATGYELPATLPTGLVALHSTYAFITTPGADLGAWAGGPLVWEASRPYTYMRTTTDGRMIAGGADLAFREPKARDALLPRRIAQVGKRVGQLMPDITWQREYEWAGTFGVTKDGLPCIGAATPGGRVLHAMGYGGNGITFSVIAARVLRDQLAGRTSADAPLYALDR